MRYWNLALFTLLPLVGCQGPMSLPAINANLNITPDARIGPGAGTTGGQHVTNLKLPLGEFCNVLDADAVQGAVSAVVGETAGSMVQVQQVILKGIVFSTHHGSFAGIDSFAVTIQPHNGAPIFVGTITRDDGLADGFTVIAEQQVDLMPLLADTHCLSVTVSYTGTTPSQNLDMRIDAFVTIVAQASM